LVSFAVFDEVMGWFSLLHGLHVQLLWLSFGAAGGF